MIERINLFLNFFYYTDFFIIRKTSNFLKIEPDGVFSGKYNKYCLISTTSRDGKKDFFINNKKYFEIIFGKDVAFTVTIRKND